MSLLLMAARARMNHVVSSNDPYWSSVTVMLRGATDLRGNTWTLYGSALIDQTGGPNGVPAISFDGSVGGYARMTSAVPPLGTGDFTVEGFVLARTAPGIAAMLLDTYLAGQAGNINDFGVAIFPSGSNFYVTYNNSNGDFAQSANLALGGFHHVALVRRSGINHVFVDGIESATSYALATVNGLSAMYLGWANYKNSAGRFLNGLIAELRVTVGVARYTSNFTPPVAPFPNA